MSRADSALFPSPERGSPQGACSPGARSLWGRAPGPPGPPDPKQTFTLPGSTSSSHLRSEGDSQLQVRRPRPSPGSTKRRARRPRAAWRVTAAGPRGARGAGSRGRRGRRLERGEPGGGRLQKAAWIAAAARSAPPRPAPQAAKPSTQPSRGLPSEQVASTGNLLPTRARPHAHSEAAKPAPVPPARRGYSGPRLRRLLPPGPSISLHFASDHHGSAPANKSAAHWEERPPTLGVGDPRDKHREGPDLACKTHLQPPTLVLQALRVPSSPSAGYDSSLSIFNIIDIVQWEKSVRHKKAEYTP